MAALTAPRSTIQSSPDALTSIEPYKVAAATKIYPGALVGVNAGGFAIPATTASIRVVGVAQALADNTSGANGDISVTVRRGTFLFNNKGGDLVVQADIGVAPAAATPKGAPCYIEDDNTVRKTAAASIVAGRVVAVETAGVWVEIY
jgi:hypothetical protein